jgi:DNA-binding Lrp family transcriptional regulator|tara:strand:+ start:209 stop:445 length:237 start_codon:yes stop_codon:yes gene_type:complete
MTTKAFVLVETAVGKTRDVAHALGEAEGILSVDVVTGPYDIIAVMEGKDITSIGDMVTEKVHFAGVVRTVTCISVGRA